MFPAYSPCDVQVVQRYQLPPSSTQVQTHCGQITGMARDPAVFEYRVYRILLLPYNKFIFL